MFEIFIGKKDIIIVRNLIIRGLAFVYLIAFVSLFGQIQGLFGDEGIYPVKNMMEKLKISNNNETSFINFPNLLIFSDKLNFILNEISPLFKFSSSEENTLHFICLFGIGVSVSIVINLRIFLNKIGFLFLFLFYLTICLSGQIFFKYQWDYLLLEAGFIGIFIAPNTKNDLSEVSSSEETSYYLMRFLMFKYCYGSGVTKLLFGCEKWTTFNAFTNLFQITPLPHFLSYYFHDLIDLPMKIITVLIYITEIYLPFCFFNCIFRRLRIFAGILTHFMQIFFMFIGNYNFHYILTIIINLSNFDDNFIIAVVPHRLLKILDLDLEMINDEKLNQIKDNPIIESKTNDKSGLKNTNENNDSHQPLKDQKNKNPYDVYEEEDNISTDLHPLKDQKNKNPYDLCDEKDNIPTDLPIKNDKKIENLQQSYFYKEILVFINLWCLLLIWIFHWVFPIKNLSSGYFKINKTEFLSIVTNNNFMNYFIYLVFTYIVLKYIWNHLDEISIEINEIIKAKSSLLIISFVSILLIKILFIILAALYFFGSVMSLYNGINLRSPNTLIKSGNNISEKYFKKLNIHNNYGLFKSNISNERLELELKYLDQNNIWKNINFKYKPSISNNNLLFIMPHQPRLDWQVAVSAYSKSIESDPFLLILLGKILERNAVTLDLLGYLIPQKENYYKLSLIDKFFSKEKFNDSPTKVKIDLYKFQFTSQAEKLKSGQYWKKSLVKEYLVPLGSDQLQKVFKNYSLPNISEKRKIWISIFQLVNVVDIVMIILFIYFSMNLIYKR